MNLLVNSISRAKIGMFIIGNMHDLCQKSKLWNSINIHLIEHGLIGNSLTLQCPNHTNSVVKVNEMNDFNNAVCNEKCGTQLSCGHVCAFECHLMDRDHRKQYACQQKCDKLCINGKNCFSFNFEMMGMKFIFYKFQAISVKNCALCHVIHVKQQKFKCLSVVMRMRYLVLPIIYH